MISCNCAVRPESTWTSDYAFALKEVDNVNGVDISTGEAVSGCSRAGCTVDVTVLAGIACVYCELAVGTNLYAIGCSI